MAKHYQVLIRYDARCANNKKKMNTSNEKHIKENFPIPRLLDNSLY